MPKRNSIDEAKREALDTGFMVLDERVSSEFYKCVSLTSLVLALVGILWIEPWIPYWVGYLMVGAGVLATLYCNYQVTQINKRLRTMQLGAASMPAKE